MKQKLKINWKQWFLLLILFLGFAVTIFASSSSSDAHHITFPPKLESYGDSDWTDIGAILSHRIEKNPFNLVASLIFLCAIIHTFLASKFLAVAHKWEHEHDHLKKEGKVEKNSVSFGAEVFHFLGEIEVVFGLWAVVLGVAVIGFYDWHTLIYYFSSKVNYTEPIFVVIIMTLAASRPVLKLSELMMWKISNLMGGMLVSWWFTILTIGPILGSFITEPAAMTISALLLGDKFYSLNPSNSFKYATLGLLFVNVSVGGTLTHFAAPPVLMVAEPWGWGLGFMASHFGWKAAIGIVIANAVYYFIFSKEMARLQKDYAIVRLQKEIKSSFIREKDLEEVFDQTEYIAAEELGFSEVLNKKFEEVRTDLKGRLLGGIQDEEVDKSMVEEAFDQSFDTAKQKELRKSLPGLLPSDERAQYFDPDWDHREEWVPVWIMIIHVLFLVWTVVNAHHPPLFIGGFLFFLGFAQVTSEFQNRINLKPALLVGFFLAGLVIHGGVQAWWIAPVLGNLSELMLLLGAAALTAFNDNAAITYLSTLVPGFTEKFKYAVVAGAVAGGGLTVIANAPNPAGQSILKKYFEDGVSAAQLFMYAFMPTVIVILCFLFL